MKISYNWLNELLPLDMEPEALGELLTGLGLEVEGMEAYESVKGGLEGVVVGKVTECKDHPNADRLRLTRVDVGGDEALHIVCGAPNVAEGQTVLVAMVGSTLYMPDGTELEIRRAKIRGELSEGMICAEDELGLGDSHEGVMVLDNKYRAGEEAKEIFPLYRDTVFDIGLTPNRSDATHHLGVARDLQAALIVREERELAIREPKRRELETGDGIDNFPVQVENHGACPRYSGVVLKGIEVAESPDWLKNRLKAIDVRPINNVVDATNLVLHEMGQPLHAFDLDKVGRSGISVRFLPEGTKFVTLDKVERKLHGEDLMICSGEGEPLCIGGVFGGLGTGVTDETRTIFLESAHFDPAHIRKSSTRHQLRTDAARVFEKGSDPSITVKALERAVRLLEEVSGAEVAGKAVDLYDKPPEREEVELKYSYLNKLTGHKFSKEECRRICKSLKFEIAEASESGLKLLVPTDKHDVRRPADVVEEVLRVYGYDRIKFDDKLTTTLIPASYPDENLQKNHVADLLCGLGFHQMMNLSLSQSRYYPGRKDLVYILNTSNVHLDIMRPDMLATGLEAVAYNLNRQQDRLRLFEFGRTYRKPEREYLESSRLTLFCSGPLRPESWTGDQGETDFFYLKGVLEGLFDKLGLAETGFYPKKRKGYMSGMEISAGESTIGYIGQLSKERREDFGVEQEIYMADLDWDALRKRSFRTELTYTSISKYPTVRRDIALVLDQGVEYGKLAGLIHENTGEELADLTLFDTYENEEQLGKGKKSYAISMLFGREDRTLTDEEVDGIVQGLVRKLEKAFGAHLR